MPPSFRLNATFSLLLLFVAASYHSARPRSRAASPSPPSNAIDHRHRIRHRPGEDGDRTAAAAATPPHDGISSRGTTTATTTAAGRRRRRGDSGAGPRNCGSRHANWSRGWKTGAPRGVCAHGVAATMTSTTGSSARGRGKSLREKWVLIAGANSHLGSMIVRHLLRTHPEVREVVAAVHYVGASTTRGYGRLSYEVGAEDGIGIV